MFLNAYVYPPIMAQFRFYFPGIDNLIDLSDMIHIKPASSHMPGIPSVNELIDLVKAQISKPYDKINEYKD